jgi:hypothetical protein
MSVSAKLPRIPPDPQNLAPERSIVLHQTRRPPTRATTALQTLTPSHCGHRNETSGIEKDQPGARSGRSAATREGTASTAIGGIRPDVATGANQALLARPSPSGLVKLPSPHCSTRTADHTTPNSSRPSARQRQHRRAPTKL